MKRVISSVVACTLILESGNSFAYVLKRLTDVVKVSKWCDENMKCGTTRNMQVIQCSMGDSSTDEFRAVANGARAWNMVFGAWDKIRVIESSDPCPASGKISYFNNVSEMAFSSAERLDNAKAVTITSRNLDDFGNVHYVDVLVRSGLSWHTTDEVCTDESADNLAYVSGHEFGHGLGFSHEDRRLLAMMKSGPLRTKNPTYCARTMTAADDARAIRAVYPSGNIAEDIAALPVTIGENGYVWAGNYASILLKPQHEFICPGESVEFPITIQNRGTNPLGFNTEFSIKRVFDQKFTTLATWYGGYRSADSLKLSIHPTLPLTQSLAASNGGRNTLHVHVIPDPAPFREESYANNWATIAGPGVVLMNSCN